MNSQASRGRIRPWHLWIVAIATFALYVGGARDFVLILIHDQHYIRDQFGAGGIDYFTDYPPLLRAVWAINVLAGLITPVLLLALNCWAVPTALAATIAQGVLLAVTFAFLDRWAMLGAMTSWFDVGIGVTTALLAGYCETMRRRGVLASPDS
ncbi:hypothetical protein G443_001281 [Actinoalloteichus cyanogriseus DSM 43889]|uniref:Uncharacterized protein n=1 Tax=Actinoalloteichus caeruleus DSM 43889 TaxID=1120930 RepID=A0ABT1JEV5_ACTCY|nr:hypothetical protein [Actinoalloteichus caeruleus DSM 43889]